MATKTESKSRSKSKSKAKASSGAKRAPRARRTGVWRTAANSDRHELYEIAVQEVVAECDFVDRVWQKLRGRVASTLREDFCGTAKACVEWARRRPGNRAIGIDLDPTVIAWGARRHRADLPERISSRVSILRADVLEVETEPVDAVVAMNFSYFSFKERETLVRYFKRVHEALVDGGILFCDAYGGSDSHLVMEDERHLDGFTYVWDQNHYNPINGDVVNHIHFRFPDGSELKRAFTYRWRLWSLPEIQEAMREAGFVRTTVYWEGSDWKGGGNGVFRPSTRGEACQGWIAYIVAEKAGRATPRAAGRRSRGGRTP